MLLSIMTYRISGSNFGWCGVIRCFDDEGPHPRPHAWIKAYFGYMFELTFEAEFVGPAVLLTVARVI